MTTSAVLGLESQVFQSLSYITVLFGTRIGLRVGWTGLVFWLSLPIECLRPIQRIGRQLSKLLLQRLKISVTFLNKDIQKIRMSESFALIK